MSHEPWVIEYRAGCYRFAAARSDGALVETPATEPTAAEALLAALAAAGYTGEPALLAMPSAWCLSSSAVLTSRRLARTRQAVAYALEERLPLSAEDMVYDFVAHDTFAFGVAVETAAVRPVVSALEQAGVELATITPTATLLLQHLVELRLVAGDGVVLLAGTDDCDLFVLSGNRPRQWRTVPLESDALTREIAALLLADEDEAVVPVMAVNLPDEVAAALAELDPEIELARVELPHAETLLAAAGDVLVRGRRPWIQLRREALGQYDPYRLIRGPLQVLLASLLLAILCLAAVGWIRGSMYQELAEAADIQKVDIFRRLFPESRVPTGVRSRLESEQRTLAGMSAGDLEAPALRPVTGDLLAVLAALPADLRFRLLEIRCEETTAYLEGEVRSHGDADEIASALRTRGFTVEPPRSELLGTTEGVSFTLRISAFPAPAGAHQEGGD